MVVRYCENMPFLSKMPNVMTIECKVIYEMFHILNCGFEIK